MTYLNVWKAWCDSGRNRRWAHRYCLNHRNLLRAADIRTQLEYRARHVRILSMFSSVRLPQQNCAWRTAERQVRCTMLNVWQFATPLARPGFSCNALI